MTNNNSKVEDIKELGVLVVIPTYNNEKTLSKIIEDVLMHTPDVLVVNDGSTDSTTEILDKFGDRINTISYSKNRGKGYALKQSFKYAEQNNYNYVISIDSDGQHFAEDIPVFVNQIAEKPNSMIVGSRSFSQEHMKAGSSFANKFSNFWFTVQTGKKLPDTQSGYRLYPIKHIRKTNILTNRYETELEILVRLAWKNVSIIPVDINVYYPPESEKISHFRPFTDFFRISVLNTFLSVVAIIYGYPSILFHCLKNRFTNE